MLASIEGGIVAQESVMSNHTMLSFAETLAAGKDDNGRDLLKLEPFVNTHWDKICERIEQTEINVIRETNSPPEAQQLMFLSELLPFMNGIVHAGSTLEGYRYAVDWAKKKLADTDTDLVLPALTLYYIVDKAMSDPNHGASSRQIEVNLENKPLTLSALWGRIMNRVQRLLISDSDRISA